MTGKYTLRQTENAIAERLSGLEVDREAMAVVGNLYRAAGAVRHHIERTVLMPHGLTWTGWVVLWVVWVWEDIETRDAASEAGISKSTLTGVVATLTRRGLLVRGRHPRDGRRVVLSLTPTAKELMVTLFPQFNAQEQYIVAALKPSEQEALSGSLREVVTHLETPTTRPVRVENA